jgi:superoxide reductase
MNGIVDRRKVLELSVLCGGAILLGKEASAESVTGDWKGLAEVDPSLFAGINRVKDPKNLSHLEQFHSPTVHFPEKVEAGKPFAVDVAVGELLHVMTPAHHIVHIALYAGNEPAGLMELSHTLNQPRATFYLVLDKPVTLVARQYCNLHGLWESRWSVPFSG